jgi:stage IV sporulation protein B
VRDSTAGVGTLSFYDVETGWFAALGHPVSDVDTQSLLTVREGRILPTSIVDVRKGQEGNPGELVGVFSIYDTPLGTIKRNTEYGIFGEMADTSDFDAGEILPMGYANEARIGPAQLIATVSANGPEAFDCEIVRVNAQSDAASKGMVIRVTDERLLEKTGGIVQGMSGCPVIQDGRLLGIVTHVFVNDPTRGYCIYAEWMRNQIIMAQ